MCLTCSPDFIMASSNENEQPITKVTKSSCQIVEISVISSCKMPSLYTLYFGKSVRISIPPRNCCPASITCNNGHDFGFRWQNSRKSNAYSFGKIHKLAWAYPGACPEVCPQNSPDRQERRKSFGLLNIFCFVLTAPQHLISSLKKIELEVIIVIIAKKGQGGLTWLPTYCLCS